jgi:hypothetical protein
MSNSEIGQFLTSRGLQVESGVALPQQHGFELPGLIHKHAVIAETIRQNDVAVLPLNTTENIDFVSSLGAGSVIEITFGIKQAGQLIRAFGVVTPDTKISINSNNNRLSIAFLGKVVEKQLWIPDHLNPTKPESVNVQDVNTYLSIACQMALVGDHESGHSIGITDPRHFLTVLADFDSGTLASQKIKQVAESERPHFGDVLEENRSMLGVFSKQNKQSQDLVWGPITNLPPISPNRPSSVLHVIISKTSVYDWELNQGRVVTQKSSCDKCSRTNAKHGLCNRSAKRWY